MLYQAFVLRQKNEGRLFSVLKNKKHDRLTQVLSSLGDEKQLSLVALAGGRIIESQTLKYIWETQMWSSKTGGCLIEEVVIVVLTVILLRKLGIAFSQKEIYSQPGVYNVLKDCHQTYFHEMCSKTPPEIDSWG